LENIDEEAVYYSSLIAMGELLKTGCTLSTDHHYLYPENFNGDLMGIQFEAADKLGMRFSPSRGSMSLSKRTADFRRIRLCRPKIKYWKTA